MNCSETKRLIDAYVDNELDLRGALEIEEHVARCPGCGEEERAVRELQVSARANLMRYAPSPEFEARLRDALHAEGLPRPVGSVEPARATAGCAASAARVEVGGACAVRGSRRTAGRRRAALLDAAVRGFSRRRSDRGARPVAARQPSHGCRLLRPARRQALVPGKLDYSVSVTDWAAEGYPLAGGRLDYVEDTPAAALVYRRAQHVVNLFVWPSKRAADEPLRRLSRRGYSAYCWVKDGMHYWAVSDLNETELQKFVELVRRQG